MWSVYHTYRDEYELEEEASEVAAQVGVAEEGSEEGEQVDRSGPYADVVGGRSVGLPQDSSQEQY